MAAPENHQAPHTTTINKTSGGGTGFVIGALVVVVLVLSYFIFAGDNPINGSTDINVTVEGADDAAAGAAENTTGN